MYLIKVEGNNRDHIRKYKQLRNNPETRKWFFNSSVFNSRQVGEWLRSRDRDLIYFGVRQAEIVGTVSMYNQSGYSDNISAEIGRIMVSPRFRGKGYGARLLLEAEKEARNRAWETLIAEIKKDNIASIKAFEKAGYLRTAEENDKYIYTLKLED